VIKPSVTYRSASQAYSCSFHSFLLQKHKSSVVFRSKETYQFVGIELTRCARETNKKYRRY